MKMENRLDEGLKANAQPVEPVVVGVPAYSQQGYPAYPAYPQQGYPPQGYPPQGYPPPGTPGYPVGAAYPPPGAYPPGPPPGYLMQPYSQAIAYPTQPMPEFGGSQDELYSISDTGVCVAIPNLQKPSQSTFYVFAMICFCLGIPMALVGLGLFIAGLALFALGAMIGGAIFGGFGVFLIYGGYLMIKRAKQATGKKEPRVTQAVIDQYISDVSRYEATMPQLAVIRASLARANPENSHYFLVTKMGVSVNNNNSSYGYRDTNCIGLLIGDDIKGKPRQRHFFKLN